MTVRGGDGFDWEAVVPRIVNPTKVAIIQLLVRERRPLSAGEMKKMIHEVKVTHGQLLYHCDTLLKAGVLELATPDPRGAPHEKYFDLAPQE